MAFMDTLYLILAMLSPIFMIMFLMFMDYLDSKKATFLYFETEKLSRLLKKHVSDGKMQLKKKMFHIDSTPPPMILGGTFFRSWRPLYIIKHDKATPMQFIANDNDRSPENLKNLTENKTLDQLLTPKVSGKGIIIYFLIGTLIGAMGSYIFAKGI